MLISVVIPTFNEERIFNTLYYLVQQTAFNQYDIEIVIADYDPEDRKLTKSGVDRFVKDFPFVNTKFIDIDRKGIAYARHVGIMNSTGKIIVNFDGDSRFSTPKGLEKMVRPIINNHCVLTCCANELDAAEIYGRENDEGVKLAMNGLSVAAMLSKHTLLCISEPGMTFSRHAYDYAGGFNDVKQTEGLLLASRMVYNHGFGSKKFVDDVAVITSARRAIAISQAGLLNTYGNYDNAFRLNPDGSLKRFY